MKTLLHHAEYIAAIFMLMCSLGAQGRTDDYHLQNPDLRRCGFFGENVASQGEWLMAGASTCTGTGQSGRGSMTVYRRGGQGYLQHQVLSPNSGVGQYFMGETGVDLSGIVFVGSCYSWPDQLSPEGKAFVYERSGDTWNLTAELVSPLVGSTGGYSTDVATGGQTIFVSAPFVGPSGGSGGQTTPGAIHIYRKISGQWTLVQLWTPPNDPAFDLAMAGNRMAADEQVLAWGSEPLNTLFIMEPDSNGVWDLVASIPNFSPRQDVYGWDIEVDGDTIVVGVEDMLAQGLGMVHVVRKVAGSWVMTDTLQAPDPNGHGDGFGYSVDLRGDRLAVGAPYAGDLGGGRRSPGAAYLYERDAAGGWNFEYKFVRPDGVMWDMLGSSVAIGDDYLLVGDRVGYVPPTNVNGAAFVFELPMGQESCSGVANSTGRAAGLEVVGTSVAATNWITLRAIDLPSNAYGYFLGSRAPGWLPGAGGSQGNLCLGGAIYRFNQAGQWGAANSNGQSEMRLDLAHPLANQVNPILAGENWSFQFWYRDHNPQPTTNFSAAIEVQFR